MLAIQRNNNKKGFTLAELLVVVAIIAVLVAVSIPIFTAKLEKAREATDIANMRAAKAEATVAILDDDYTNEGFSTSDSGVTYVGYYDADAGKFVTTAPANKYGKGTTKDGGMKYGTAATGLYSATTPYTGQVIKATITVKTESVLLSWE